ncbi:MAG TPA: DUF6338 family protein [Amycolatopsis sp.]|jgi:small nuclear ribonucleoprotein (snRNP)-like protein
MVPSTAGGLVGLLLVLAPGILYELIRQRSRPGRGDSTFVEVSRILLAGVLVSLTVLILLDGFRALDPRLFADPQALLSQPGYLAAHLGLVAWTVAWFLVLAMTIPAVWLYNTPGKNAHAEIRQESQWVAYFDRIPHQYASDRNESPPVTYLQVRTADGVLYRGRLAAYDNGLDLDDRELTLSQPNLITKPVAEPWESLASEKWSAVIIRGNEIKDIWVLNLGPGKGPAPARRRRVPRIPAHWRLVVLLALELLALGQLAVLGR